MKKTKNKATRTRQSMLLMRKAFLSIQMTHFQIDVYGFNRNFCWTGNRGNPLKFRLMQLFFSQIQKKLE